MTKKLSDTLNELSKIDLDAPSIEELCKKNDPALWGGLKFIMWGLFFVFLSASIFNNFKNAQSAKNILERNQEIPAKVIDVIQILEDGKYTDYSVDFELDKAGTTYAFNLDIKKDEFEKNYKKSKTIPIIFADERNFNLKKYYVSRSNIFSNWISILIGYILVFVLFYVARHYCIKLFYKGPR